MKVIFFLVKWRKTSSRAFLFLFLASSSPLSPSRIATSSSTSSLVLGIHARIAPSECAENISTLPALHARDVILLLTFRCPAVATGWLLTGEAIRNLFRRVPSKRSNISISFSFGYIMTWVPKGVRWLGGRIGKRVDKCVFWRIGPKCDKVSAPVPTSQTRTRSSWPALTRYLPSSFHTTPLQAPTCAFPWCRGRAFLPSPSSPPIPMESSKSNTPRQPALLRISQSLTEPSEPPLARMFSSCGLHATDRTAPWWPASEWTVAPERRSTSRTAGCWVAQATRRWSAMADRACE